MTPADPGGAEGRFDLSLGLERSVTRLNRSAGAGLGQGQGLWRRAYRDTAEPKAAGFGPNRPGRSGWLRHRPRGDIQQSLVFAVTVLGLALAWMAGFSG
ncbi:MULTISPECIES: hypothetical protein [unclassified Roseitalea]|uniref:hypothetical protein n=1 Tax=unclassified Roseitalea TaxID=2639107 RepID=UPI00273DDE52|nr:MULTISPECIES: hypothetical protein [unclassified Roseitalea]